MSLARLTRVVVQMVHRQGGMKVYSEVDAAATLLGYSVINAGCCKVTSRLQPCTAAALVNEQVSAKTQAERLQVMVHPTFGTKVYPARCEHSGSAALSWCCSLLTDSVLQPVCEATTGQAGARPRSPQQCQQAAARVVLAACKARRVAKYARCHMLVL